MFENALLLCPYKHVSEISSVISFDLRIIWKKKSSNLVPKFYHVPQISFLAVCIIAHISGTQMARQAINKLHYLKIQQEML